MNIFPLKPRLLAMISILGALLIFFPVSIHTQITATKEQQPTTQPVQKTTPRDDALAWLINGQPKPQVNHIPLIVKILSELKSYESPQYSSYSLGMLYGLFRAHPLQLRDWYEESFKQLPLQHRGFIIGAIWMSNTKPAIVLLNELSNTEVKRLQPEINKIIKQSPPDILNAPITSHTQLQFMWGYYLATADKHIPQLIIDQLAQLEHKTKLNAMKIGTTARTTLFDNALRIPAVHDTLKKNQKHPNQQVRIEVTTLLRQIAQHQKQEQEQNNPQSPPTDE